MSLSTKLLPRKATSGTVDARKKNLANFLRGSKAPRVTYHGTTTPENFSTFAVGEPVTQENEYGEHETRQGSGADPSTYLGSHFAEEPETANKFAKGLYGEREHASGGHRVMPVHLRVKKPYVTTDSAMRNWMLTQKYGHHDVDYALDQHDDPVGHKYENNLKHRRTINEYALGMAQHAENPDTSLAQEMAERLRDNLIKKGHDGIKYKNEIEGGTSWIAFKPHQIKSAIGNNGTFDPNNPDITKARGGAVNHAPSEAQKAAGNYRKKHISFQGLNIAIENEKGSIRKGKSASGHAWRCVLPCDYGYIKGTVGADKDHVDCYVGPDEDSHIVFVVNQHNPGKGFDEHKVMLGFKSEEDALCCYVAAFSDGSGPKRIGSVATMSLDGFKKWLHRGRTTKPVARGSIIDHAMQLVAAKGAGA